MGAIQRTGCLQRPEHTWARPPSQLALAFLGLGQEDSLLGLGQQDSPLHWLSLGLSLRFLRSSIVCARSCLPHERDLILERDRELWAGPHPDL